MKNGIFNKDEAKKIKLRLTEFEMSNLFCKLLRTKNEFTTKLTKFVEKVIEEKSS